MKVHLPHEGSPYTRIVVEEDSHLSDELIQPYAETAVELADRDRLPVHIQSQGEFTHLIIYPEAA